MLTSHARTLIIVACVLFVGAAMALATPPPEQACQASKNRTAGRYAACRQNAESKLAISGDMIKYNGTIGKCATKFWRAWQKATDKVAAAGATCLDAPLTTGDFSTVIDEHAHNIATALAGGGLTECAGDLASCDSDLETVKAGTAVAGDVLAGKTFSSGAGLGLTGTMVNNGAVNIVPTTTAQTIAAGYHNGAGTVAGDVDLVAGNIKSGVNLFGVTGTLQPPPLKTGQTTSYGPGSDGDLQRGASRSYIDNGDGTITDNTTGLMWEKKSYDGSIHYYGRVYTWGMTSSPYTMNGTMVTTFLAALNSGTGFAGHTDWRIPNANELQSIVSYDLTPTTTTPAVFRTACVNGCNVLTCSCTAQSWYWTSTTYVAPWDAYSVSFASGALTLTDFPPYDKSTALCVRAVRGGS